jgi:hypothetical protein
MRDVAAGDQDAVQIDEIADVEVFDVLAPDRSGENPFHSVTPACEMIS